MFARWKRLNRRREPRSLYGNLIAYMEDRLEEQPSDLRLRISLASHLQMAGRYEEAIRQVHRVLQVNPDHRRAKGMLLRLRLEQRFSGIRHPRP